MCWSGARIVAGAHWPDMWRIEYTKMRSIILALAALLVSAIPAKADCPAGRVSSCYRLGGKIVCGCCPTGTVYSCHPIFGGKMFCGCH